MNLLIHHVVKHVYNFFKQKNKFLEFIIKSIGMYIAIMILFSLLGALIINKAWVDYFDKVLYLTHHHIVISASITTAFCYFCYLVMGEC